MMYGRERGNGYFKKTDQIYSTTSFLINTEHLQLFIFVLRQGYVTNMDIGPCLTKIWWENDRMGHGQSSGKMVFGIRLAVTVKTFMVRGL